MIRLFKLTVTIVVCVLAKTLWAQSTCDTPRMDSLDFYSKPWIGNNKFLLDLVDSIGYGESSVPKTTTGGFDQGASYWVPVKAWVYNNSNGTGGISEVEVERSIRKLNEYFSGEINETGRAHSHIQIQFYLRCAIGYVNNSNFAINASNSEVEQMWNTYHETAALNIHFVPQRAGNAGRGRFPGSNKSFACLVVTNHTNPDSDDDFHLNATLPHEVGHAFDLLHPHEGRCSGDNSDCGNCWQEAVSRAKIQPVGCGNFSGDKKCELNGDGLCDTEADPKLTNSNDVPMVELVSSNPNIYAFNGSLRKNPVFF